MSNTENKDLIEAQFHCRNLQLSKIAGEVEADIAGDLKRLIEVDTDCGWIFAALMLTPQIYAEAIIGAVSNEKRERFWDKATKCLILVARSAYLRNILAQLVEVSNPSLDGTKIIELDNYMMEASPASQLAFKTNPEALEIGHLQGKKEATDYLLGKLSGDIPLMRYRRDLLLKTIRLDAAFGVEVLDIFLLK